MFLEIVGKIFPPLFGMNSLHTNCKPEPEKLVHCFLLSAGAEINDFLLDSTFSLQLASNYSLDVVASVTF